MRDHDCNVANKALHLSAISMRSIVADELRKLILKVVQ